MAIMEAEFHDMVINIGISRSSLVAKITDEEGSERSISLDKTVTFKEVNDNEFVAKSSTVKSMMVANMVIYDKSTIFFEKNAEVAKKIESMLENGENKNIAVLYSSGNQYMGIPPKNIQMQIDGVVQSRDGNDDISETAHHEKENLKAYETPSDVYDILLSTQQTMVFDHIANKIAKGYAGNLYKKYSSEVKNTTYSKDIFTMELASVLLQKANGVDISNLEADKDASKHSKTIAKLFLSMQEEQEKANKLLSKIGEISVQMFPLKIFYEDTDLRELVKELSGFDEKRFKFPVMDLQAGSGEGLLKGFDNAGYKDNILFGTEIRRNIQQDDERYRVLLGKNSVTYGSAIESVFENKTLRQAIKNLQIYSNPPYTSEDYVTKKTFESMDGDSMLYGLFPQKSHKLLKHEIDGVIIDVPKEITGYTDPKTPERFMMVFGALHGEDEKVGGGSSLFGGSVRSLPTNETIVFDIKDDESLDDAKKRLSFLISNTASRMSFLKSRVREQYNYYVDGEDNRISMVEKNLETKIEQFDNFLNSIESREKALENAKNDIFKQFTPLDIAKTQKVFPDTRYYLQNGNPTNFYFKDVINNVSLLSDYQQKSPSLFNIIKDVAEDLNIKMPISVEDQNIFKLTERNIPKEKNQVTNMELGLMKSKYYPSLIDLSQEDDKKEMISIFTRVSAKNFKGDALEKGIENLKLALEYAEKMVLKNEQILLREEGIIQNRECYVLQDAYENDIGKLNMSLTDFYDELQTRGRFNIEDYVELVEISPELKKKLVVNFLEYTENIARTIEQKKDIKELDIIKDAFSVRQKIGSMFKKFNEKSAGLNKDSSEYKAEVDEYNKSYREVLLNFIQTHKLDRHLEDKIIYPNMNSLLNQVVNSDDLINFKNKDKTAIKKMISDRFLGREIIFYEDKTNEYDYFKDRMKNYGIEGEKFDDFFFQMYDAVTPMFVAKKASVNSYVKMGAMFVMDYTKMKLGTLKGVNAEKIFDSSFEKMFLDTFGLRPHQYNEAINTAAIDKKLSMLLWEMRSGKTLTMAATLFMVGLSKNEDMSLFVETANLQDISNQVFEYMPQMFFQLRVFHTEPKKVALNDDIIYERLLSERFYPNILSILNKRDSDLVTGGGTTINGLKPDYNVRMEKLIDIIGEKELTVEQLKEQFAESPLLGLLDICDG